MTPPPRPEKWSKKFWAGFGFAQERPVFFSGWTIRSSVEVRSLKIAGAIEAEALARISPKALALTHAQSLGSRHPTAIALHEPETSIQYQLSL